MTRLGARFCFVPITIPHKTTGGEVEISRREFLHEEIRACHWQDCRISQVRTGWFWVAGWVSRLTATRITMPAGTPNTALDIG